MWDLTIPGDNDHDFYVIPSAVIPAAGKPFDAAAPAIPAAVLVHNVPCPGFTGEMQYAQGTGAARGFQIQQTGLWEFEVAGGGETVWADGFEGTTLVDTKYTGSGKSPYRMDTTIPPDVLGQIDAKEVEELSRYAAVIGDHGTGFTRLRIVTNSPDSVSYWEWALDQAGLNNTNSEIVVARS
jgi:hypothetical protein